ncbi:MAG: hypothetical protein ACXQTF_02100 [Candidatus Hecatellaceae archaeon]
MSLIIQLSHCGLATTALVHRVLTLLSGVMLLAVRLSGRRPHVGWPEVLRAAHTTLGVLTGFYGTAAYLVAPR